eukprot:2596456-Amphidinium_carterae.1
MDNEVEEVERPTWTWLRHTIALHSRRTVFLQAETASALRPFDVCTKQGNFLCGLLWPDHSLPALD